MSHTLDDRPLSHYITDEVRRSAATTYPIVNSGRQYRNDYTSAYPSGQHTTVPNFEGAKLKFHIITADVICSYYRLPNALHAVSMRDQARQREDYRMVTTLQYSIFNIFRDIAPSVMMLLRDYYTVKLTLSWNLWIPLLLKGMATDHWITLGSNFIFDMIGKARHHVHQYTSPRRDLNKGCLTIYKHLCQQEFRKEGGAHLQEPYEHRNYFIELYGDRMPLVQEYANIPGRVTFALYENNTTLIATLMSRWRDAIRHIRHVADEAGMVLLLLYPAYEIAGESRPLLVNAINGMFSSFVPENFDQASLTLYKTIVKSCFVVLLLVQGSSNTGSNFPESSTDPIMNFIQHCVLPLKGSSTSPGKKQVLLAIQNEMWNEIEEELQIRVGSLGAELRRRPSLDELMRMSFSQELVHIPGSITEMPRTRLQIAHQAWVSEASGDESGSGRENTGPEADPAVETDSGMSTISTAPSQGLTSTPETNRVFTRRTRRKTNPLNSTQGDKPISKRRKPRR